MSFLQPMMLWSLLAIIPLAAIYFLKVRPQRRPTTAYFLWEKIFQEKRASSLFQRLRDVLSLILMALAAAAVCFALAQPEWNDDRQDLLIVVDNSASMGAGGGGATRLDEAKRLAAGLIEGLNGSQRAAVATIGRNLTYRSHLTDNPRELLNAVEQIETAPETLADSALAELAEAGATSDRRRILLVSDGAYAADRVAKDIELFKVGAAAENIGLVAADVAYLPGGDNRLGVYFQTASTFSEPQECDLTLSHVGDDGQEQLLKVIPLEVTPGVNPPERFTLEDAPAGRWIARIDRDDALAADNVAYLAVRKPKPINVAVESSDRFFLENSVVAFSGDDALLKLVEDGGAVTVGKSISPDASLAVIFQPDGESPWWSELGDEVEVGAPRVLHPEHAALAHVDAATIPFVGARQLTPAPGAHVLVADDSGLPLIYVARRDGRSAIVVNLDPVNAEFYFSAWFPVLVHSAVTHLVGRETPLAASYRPGEKIPTLAASEDAETTLVDAAGKSTAAAGKWRDLPSAAGFCRLKNASGDWDVGASLLSEQESLVDGIKAADSRKPISQGRSPVHWLTLLAIFVLTGESILYHRRKVG
ncbi:vWA domain-containing protein [Lacipirellula parvula]|uniref:VWFA domain-containing protein n=1 Tax=Lacipirellula parvula TaxID=2650471 RepID=A0A5K7XPG2_9BACT|nr:BatA and WFA domain-containing protein [Lacipirellula parvula]BBO35259.1 hypothetical protein PLANPX_4871 [Lacipirellula parvula]